MESDTVRSALLRIISRQYSGTDTSRVDMDAPLSKVYGINSITIIKLVVEVEKEFGIEIDQGEYPFETLKCLNDFVRIIELLVRK
jgi:acyl carrier protein